MVATPLAGAGLEARVQRLFLAQGVFAERHLFPTASPDHRMLATDIDVLISEYVSGFHVTRRHAECKGGKTRLLDRILWLRGVRTLLQADGSYLILSDFDTDVSEFARSLDIQLLTLKQLQEWEVAIPVPPDLWPCRSEYLSYDTARKNWKKLSSGKETDPDWRLLREILSFIEIDSWLTFRYRNLNKLLRLIVALAEEYPKVRSDLHRELCSRYVFSALIVRFCQYLLDVCYDLTRIPTTEIAGYLQQRLTFGDQDPERAGKLIEATVDWIRQSLKKHGIALPPEVDVGRLYESPSYAGEFVELTNRLIRKSNEARYLPIAMEVSQFGSSEVLAKFPRLRAAASAGETLAAMVKGFVNRTFSIPKELTKPIADQLKATYHSTSGQLSKSREGATQLHLEGEDK